MPETICDLTHPGIDYLVVPGLCFGPRCAAYFDGHADDAVDAATDTDIDP